jgi:type IV pilus assembly protein PilA
MRPPAAPIRRGDGFTLVELLIVMAIIGLLATIAIPAYFNQREKAQDAGAKELVATAHTAMEAFSLGDGSYAGADPAGLHGVEPTLPDGPPLTVDSDPDSYEVAIESESGTTFELDRHPDGSLEFLCDPSGSGGCGSDGTWN